ncbi:MAG TPA: phosphoenolpyruvate carboxylase, partial [Gaiellaceae bacterium]|nr:phosphoenolpyruvate carboxylase [Gaiellaceae bacterium]
MGVNGTGAVAGASPEPRGRASARAADAPLRRDVRLLGEVLGRVLVEQHGPGLLEDVERVRLLSREARASGRPARRAELRRA